MTVTAIIAEYNPFHLGHKYHIEQAKLQTNADIILVIMSGNYVQRGEPAIFDKHLRASVAIENGADMVIELPYPYSCSSAEYFAEASITILDKLGCVDYLCFGSEYESINDLYDIANLLIEEPECYKSDLKEQLKSGISFPKARHNALINILKENKYDEILKLPNNILGIEYIKSLLRLESKIQPICIKRIISDYHHNENNNPYYSASSIRNGFNLGNIDFDELTCISPLYSSYNLHPIDLQDFSNILSCKILEHINNLDDYFDISSDLADRIANNIDNYINFVDFIELLKTKNINYTSISRGLTNLMLEITKDDIDTFRHNGYADYVRVLKFNDKALPLFKLIQDKNNIQLITSLTKADAILETIPEHNQKIYSKTFFADNLYRLVTQNKYNSVIPNEFQHKIK